MYLFNLTTEACRNTVAHSVMQSDLEVTNERIAHKYFDMWLADFFFFWQSCWKREEMFFLLCHFVHHIQFRLYKRLDVHQQVSSDPKGPFYPLELFAWWKSPDLLCAITALQESTNIIMWRLQLPKNIDINHLDWETQKTYLVEGTTEPRGKTSLTAQSSQTASMIRKPPSGICCTSLHHFFTRHRGRALKWRAERPH